MPAAIAERYFQLIAERATGKPTQYITGHQEFWGLDFEVTPDVLIPRPETEHVVETVLDVVARRNLGKEASLRIVDVGTGSGCIILALASELPNAQLFGTDISPAALAVAKRNAARLGLAACVQFAANCTCGQPQKCGVALGHGQRGRRDIRAEEPGVGEFRREGEDNATGPRADIDDTQRRFHAAGR